ncbi:uncharacterized protein CELE_D1007.5 [Caenorhabditis elegans]|uniref:TMEM (Human TransMEMbrane protein) homolog n=1 Tax=Caenorhabditis elegans TaxID=6239 RepID=O01870_CAEEL|nr:uncharacterized protein CELE_D1007.5 [Caenorhabditis elegans]CCD67315.1 TMEM (human TransMEMbrane protein) homolog [Caenorhabditis elegans]|eukprot:NP_001021071.1 Uncharacterized protein CELE_D1007.5 [Caenorhabditis elegans]
MPPRRRVPAPPPQAPSVPASIPRASGVTLSVHPIWPDIQFTQGELFFECTLFLYSVLALFLQYLNIYKTLWWLPKSYWHYSLKFHLINPYFLSCVGLLLGWRVTVCFWKTITEVIATISANQSQFIQSSLMIVEYAAIKTPVMTLIITSFLFSFNRVCHDFPSRSVLWFLFPILFYAFIFRSEIIGWLGRFREQIGKWRRREIEFSDVCERLSESPPAQIDLESVLHMCSDSPAQIREEIQVLIDDLVLRVKKSIFAGVSTAFLSIMLPCIFVPFKTSQGIPQKILINEVWECQLAIVVGLTAFSLYVAYLSPLNYLDLLHRAAIHLGSWHQIEGPRIGHTGSMSSAPTPWSEFCLYNDGETVQMPDGRCYRAKSSNSIRTVAAHPESSRHNTFFKVLRKPNNLINIMCSFEFLLIFIQFWMLVLTNDWQHIVTFVLLMFANYLLFAKLFKDKIILSRIYEPSQEDLLLMHQLQQER